jgi:hypothetical protein
MRNAGDFSNWDTSGVTAMNYLFEGADIEDISSIAN